jgi:hypothetical protein
MLNFKEVESTEDAVSIYKTIQSEVAEFEPTQSLEDLEKSYKLAQREFNDNEI